VEGRTARPTSWWSSGMPVEGGDEPKSRLTKNPSITTTSLTFFGSLRSPSLSRISRGRAKVDSGVRVDTTNIQVVDRSSEKRDVAGGGGGGTGFGEPRRTSIASVTFQTPPGRGRSAKAGVGGALPDQPPGGLVRPSGAVSSRLGSVSPTNRSSTRVAALQRRPSAEKEVEKHLAHDWLHAISELQSPKMIRHAVAQFASSPHQGLPDKGHEKAAVGGEQGRGGDTGGETVDDVHQVQPPPPLQGWANELPEVQSWKDDEVWIGSGEPATVESLFFEYDPRGDTADSDVGALGGRKNMIRLRARRWLEANGFHDLVLDDRDGVLEIHAPIQKPMSLHPSSRAALPMHEACHVGHMGMCEFLFREGHDLQEPDAYGNLPIHWATRSGHLHVLKWLYMRSPLDDLNAPNGHGFTPMMIACRKGHLAVCQWLYGEFHLQFPVYDDALVSPLFLRRDTRGDTSLHFACAHGQSVVARWILEQTMRGYVRDEVVELTGSSEEEESDLLIHHDKSDLADSSVSPVPSFATRLSTARTTGTSVATRRRTTSQGALRRESEVSRRSSTRSTQPTPQHFRAGDMSPLQEGEEGPSGDVDLRGGGLTESARDLLLWRLNRRAEPPVYAAVRAGDLPCVRILSPLMKRAVSLVRLERVAATADPFEPEPLLHDLEPPDKSSIPKHLNSENKTLLHVAAGAGAIGIAKYLLETKVVGWEQVQLRDSQGRSPLHIAAEHGELAMCRWLHSLCETSGRVARKIFADLLVARDDFRRSPLYLSSRHGHESTCRWLLDLGGLPPPAEDFLRKSPLVVALRYNQMRIAELLILSGILTRPLSPRGRPGPLARKTTSGNRALEDSSGRLLIANWATDMSLAREVLRQHPMGASHLQQWVVGIQALALQLKTLLVSSWGDALLGESSGLNMTPRSLAAAEKEFLVVRLLMDFAGYPRRHQRKRCAEFMKALETSHHGESPSPPTAAAPPSHAKNRPPAATPSPSAAPKKRSKAKRKL